MKVSFILPCYNVAPYIGRCLDSIEHQDMPQAEYEVICVDDCSIDNTVDVIKEYQKRYSNIQLICHKENKTAGGARNTGMDAAKGEYIWFVDPDDAVAENVIAMLYSTAKNNVLDILFFNKKVHVEKGDSIQVSELPEVTNAMGGQEFFLEYFSKKHMAQITSVWRELFKTDFLRSHLIRFPEIRSSQDVPFAWKSFLLADRVMTCNEAAYDHFRRENSTTGSAGKYKAKNVMSSSLLYAEELEKIVNAISMDEILKEDIIFGMKNAINENSRKVIHMSVKEQRLFFDEMKRNSALVEKHKQIMNRKTKQIFNYHLPYILWQMIMFGYVTKDKIKI